MGYKIIYDKKACIGAGECEALSPDFWKVDNAGKAQLNKGLETKEGVFELDISDEDCQKQEDVAGSCPAGCIRIVKNE